MMQQKQKERESTVEIIRDYAAKTRHQIKDVKRIPNGDREYKIWIYADEFENQLGMREERLHYLMIKKRWQEQYDWSDSKTTKWGKIGITIPYVAYEFIMSRKNLINELVVCVISDINRWKYTDIQPYYYYRITLEDMHNFAKKTYTIFKNKWEEEVIGFPMALFKRV
jgi:hypothetical protein